MTIVNEVIIRKSWWNNFKNEAICDDARGLINEDGSITDNDDWLMVQTASLLITCKPEHRLRNNKTFFTVYVTDDELNALYNHADWYSDHYYECATEAWDKSERMQLLAKSRSSKAFHKYLHAEFYAD